MEAQDLGGVRLHRLLQNSFSDLEGSSALLNIDIGDRRAQMLKAFESELQKEDLFEQLLEKYVHHIPSDGQSNVESPFLLALYFHLEAQEALGTGDVILAWELYAKSQLYSGRAEGLQQRVPTYNGNAGGIARKARYAAIKSEVVKVLAEPPVEGWGKRRDTAILLSKILADKFADYEFIKDPQSRIYLWLGNAPEIRAEYLKHS